MTNLWPRLAAERIHLAEELEFDLGGMRVHPPELAVEMDGRKRELQPRVMQVLVALAKKRPAVVSRDKLVELCWEGRVVGDDALNRCVLALRHLAQEFTPHPFAIETVPRVGHRLVECGAEAAAVKEEPRKPQSWRVVAILALFLVAAIGGLFLWQQRGAQAEPASIAVLPFRNLSAGDPYFAEGVGEEILNQLAREPAFRVAGRASAANFSATSDPREVGRKLRVHYILEGSVRSDGGRVRVNAALVKTNDGMRLWSETYDRRLEDILEIQSSIGQAVANELRRRLIHLPFGRAINGEAYALYLNARGLLRSQSPEVGSEAVGLLQQSVKLDPGFAPAWASLAEAFYLDARTKGVEGLIAVLPRAQAAARRALHIDPNLAQAHGAMAQLLGYETPAGIAHLRRAAELAPRTGEGLMWRAFAHNATDEFSLGLEAFQRAHELDPVWPFPLRALIDMNAELGNRAAAEAAIREGFPGDAMTQHFALARVALFFGDFSDAARRYAIVAKSPARWARPSQRTLADLQFTLGISKSMPAPSPAANVGSSNRYVPRVWMAAPPSPAEWRRRNRSPAAALVYHDENIVAAKLMLNAGRARELVAAFDGPTGLLGLRRGQPLGPCQFQEVPLVALALRTVGRGEEADALFRQADARLRAAYRRGKVPTFFDGDAAGVWAAQGNSGAALKALERAIARGWLYAGRLDLPDLADEPAFRPLRNDPRFKAVLARYQAHFVRERQETPAALKIPA